MRVYDFECNTLHNLAKRRLLYQSLSARLFAHNQSIYSCVHSCARGSFLPPVRPSSLQSRDLIADSIETVMGAQWYDANVSIPGCDKNMPGTVMAMARLNRPSLMIYGGTIKVSVWQ